MLYHIILGHGRASGGHWAQTRPKAGGSVTYASGTFYSIHVTLSSATTGLWTLVRLQF